MISSFEYLFDSIETKVSAIPMFSYVAFCPVPHCSDDKAAIPESSSVVGGDKGTSLVFVNDLFIVRPASHDNLAHIAVMTLFIIAGVNKVPTNCSSHIPFSSL